MSTGAIDNAIPTTGNDAGSGIAAPSERTVSFWKRAWTDTLRNKRARVSLIWVWALIILSVFAPFLANSHPLILRQGGKWSSPAFRHLTPPDVILLVSFFAGVTLLCVRAIPYRFLIFVSVVMVTMLLSYLLVKPPQIVVYSQHREDAKAGVIENAIYAPVRFSPLDRQWEKRLDPPTREHWFGMDGNGSDVLSRIIHASRIALTIGFISTGIAVTLGILIGGLMGYFAGKVDLFGMRLIEIFEAVPRLFLLIAFVAFYGRNLYMIMAIIGLTGWTGDARFIRAEFLRLRNQDFVQAARAAGLPLWSILFRHMLPNGVTPVLISASFGVASAILAESTLSFLGLGLVEEPSWGGMLDQARTAGRFIWWLTIYPGLAIFLTVFSYNLIGESMRDALDPKLRGVD